MQETVQKFIFGFFAAVIVGLVFVSAGRTGESGGKQSADIIQAGGGSLSNLAKGLYSA